MRQLLLLLLVQAGCLTNLFSQTSFKDIASNRIIQKYHNQQQLEKIATLDDTRLQTLYSYFTASFSFSSLDNSVDINKLLNIYHFDVYSFENLRDPENPVSFTFHDNITVTLLAGSQLTQLLGGYALTDLIEKIPNRPFPSWTAQTFTESDFKSYKEQVWDWARDYPQDYLTLTSDAAVRHISFSELVATTAEKRTQLLTGQYIVVE